MAKQAKADQVSLNIFDLIDSICADFRKEWKTSKRPRIEDYLLKLPENAREQLFRNLLQLEVRYRRRAGDSPSSNEYHRRFRHFASAIRREFDESTMASMAAMSGTPAEDSAVLTATIDLPAANRLGDYELICELGRGGMGVVYEARHIKHGNRVALKTLPTGNDGQQVNAERLHRFRKEFRSLSEINHPNLVGMQSLEVDGSQWFFTMDLINGEEFLSYVRPNDQLDEARLRSCLKQLATGVMKLHRRGIIHRDLKPSNVLVSSDGRLTILDFGLAAELQKATDMTLTRSGMFAGTPRYAAPEQMFGERTEASDWYAFGTMLYEALTGKPPFHDNDRLALLRQKQEQDPPQLSDHHGLPSDLAVLADGLVRRESIARMTSDGIGQQLGLDHETRTSGSTRDSHGSTGSVYDEDAEFNGVGDDEIVLIGREVQLAQLEALEVEFLETRQPQIMWVTGLSGEGKSSLVEKFLQPIRRRHDVLVFSGRCYDRESVPFKVIDSQVESLVRFMRSRSDDEVRELLPRDVEILAHLFPLLRRIPAIAERSPRHSRGLEEMQVRALAFSALSDLLSAISELTPIIMFVDDLQWGDADSAEVLVNVLNQPKPPTMILLGSFRSDEMGDSPFLKEWHECKKHRKGFTQVRTVEVSPLTEAECLELMHVKLGGETDKAIRKHAANLFADTKGNPYFVEQFLASYDATTGTYQTIPLSEMIADRLRHCPSGAETLLDVVAVRGKPGLISEIAPIAEQADATIATLTHMRNERLVRLVGSQQDQLVDTYHDKIRENILDGLAPERKKQIHRQIAERLEQFDIDSSGNAMDVSDISDNRIFDLAHHFHEAGDSRAHAYQLEAGKRALAKGAFEDALVQLRSVLYSLPDGTDAEHQFQLLYMLGRAHSGSGDMSACLECLRRSLEHATNDVDRSRTYYAIGEASNRMGDLRVAFDSFERALELVDEPLPKTKIGKIAGITWAMLRFHLAPTFTTKRVIAKKRRDQLSQASKIYPVYTQIIAAIDPLPFVFGVTRNCLVAQRIGSPGIMRLAYANYAAALVFAGFPRSGTRMLSRASTHCDSDQSEYEKCASLYYEGFVQFGLGNLDAAEQLLNGSYQLTRRSDNWIGSLAVHFLRHLWSVRGNAAQVLRFGQLELTIGQRTGDKVITGEGLYAVADALALCGNTQEALHFGTQAIESLESIGFNFLSVAYHELGKAHLQASDYDNARKSLGRAASLVFRGITKGRLCFFTAPVIPSYAEALVGEAWHDPSVANKAHLRKAKRFLKLARGMKFSFSPMQAHTLRVLGRLAAIQNNGAKAEKLFDTAIGTSKRIGLDYDLARSLVDRSRINSNREGDDLERGLCLLESLGCVLPDAEVEYLGIEREAHHARAAAARARHEAEMIEEGHWEEDDKQSVG